MSSQRVGMRSNSQSRDISKRYGIYTPEPQPTKTKRSSWSLRGRYVEQPEALASSDSLARPVYPLRKDSLSKIPTSSHFVHRTPKQPNTEVAPGKDKRTRNVLRRKSSSIAPPAPSAPPAWSNGNLSQYGRIPEAMSNKKNEAKTNDEISPPTQEAPRIIPELDRYRNYMPTRTSKEKLASEIPHKISTQNLPLYSSSYSGRYSGYSASPSTQFSESSYSRNTTPTSISSQSPGVMAPKINPRKVMHNSPARTRPPVTRRRTENETDIKVELQGLPSVRESLTSSSSSSTVKDERGKEKKKKRLSPLPPSPPPRKSSQKFRRNEEYSVSGPTIPPVLGAGDDLAALQYAVDAHHIHTRSRTAPPMRPSREGTPDLTAQMARLAQMGDSMGFHHSNLSFSNTGEIDPSFTPAPLSRSEASTPLNFDENPRPTFHSKIPSRGYSPSPMNQGTREVTAPSGLGIVPDLRPQEKPHPGTRMRTPSPAPSTRRFGLFGRRTVTDPPPKVLEKKAPRRGPQAGTGHEGYGKYAVRGRSTSSSAMVTNQSFPKTSSARDSVRGKAIQDPFLLQRLSPVVIAGGGEIVENHNLSPQLSRTESWTSFSGLARPSLESKGSYSRPSPVIPSPVAGDGARGTLWPSALPRNSGSIPPPMVKDSRIRRPSDSSDNEMKPTLAVRRSMQRFQSHEQEKPLSLPKPINVSSRGPSPAISSHDGTAASLLSWDDVPVENIGLRRVAKSKIIDKPKRSRSPQKKKWNFFQRAQAGKPEPEVPATVITEPAPKTVANYAMMAMDEQEALEKAIGLEGILRELSEAESVPLGADTGSYLTKLRRQSQIHQPVLSKYESPLDLRADVEKTRAQLELRETALARTASSRPRLQQVGRIPQVNTTRPTEPIFVTESGEEIRASVGESSSGSGEQSKVSGEAPMIRDDENNLSGSQSFNHILNIQSEENNQSGSQSSNRASIILDAVNNQSGAEDFIRFSQRKDSVATASSSSFSGLLPVTENITAIIPEAEDPLAEDEIWDEFDDLVEGTGIPIRASATSSHGVPFQYEHYESKNISETILEMLKTEAPKSSTSSEFNPESFIAGYRDRNNSISTETERNRRSSLSVRPQRGSGPPPLSMHRKSSSLGSNPRSSLEFKPLAKMEKPAQTYPYTNLRLDSMRISRWLTFGEVLFSPIRETIANLPKASSSSKPMNILVIDGLGNDDWAFYAAETYPEVTFYNLSRSPSTTSPRKDSPFLPASPENHRQIQHLSLAERFPFPGNMFSGCVLRFPIATQTATYNNLVSEAKRVLKPGGWLELNVLDLEMTNLGHRARRAVRGLKVKMQVSDPAVHLQSSIEMLEWLVAKNGFIERKSCKVAIPVASMTVSTSSSSSPSKANADADFSTASQRGRGAQSLGEEEKTVDLVDLMRDESPSSDVGIAMMVARVGRWWYSRCFESLVLPYGSENSEESIWSDDTLLNECAKWNTTFTLFVGYSRKPIAGDWRTRGSSL